jgi:poly[(R)-3-hydroxyalkanoate] polymerase subunit PhaC
VSGGPATAGSDLAERMRREVERSILRARNGIRYVTTAPNVGATPKDVVWRRGRAELWRYHGGPIEYDPPLVFVPSIVSRSYILDLRPGNSTVEFFLRQGMDVFLLDWGVADERDAENTIETYVDEYLPRAVAAVRRETGCDEVPLVGYCLGGVFAFLYASGREDAAVRNLVLLATPLDFAQMGSWVAPVVEGRLEPDDVVDETGNIPADALYAGFYMQAPTKELALYATLLENLWNDEFVEGYQAMAQWSRDQLPFPGAAARQVVDELVRKNVLMTGKMRLGGRVVDFADFDGYVLNAFAEKDNVVAAAAAEPASALVGKAARRHELRLGGGHVTFAAGSRAFKQTLPAIMAWLAEHGDAVDPPRER